MPLPFTKYGCTSGFDADEVTARLFGALVPMSMCFSMKSQPLFATQQQKKIQEGGDLLRGLDFRKARQCGVNFSLYFLRVIKGKIGPAKPLAAALLFISSYMGGSSGRLWVTGPLARVVLEGTST
jgi:hypothetical protein